MSLPSPLHVLPLAELRRRTSTKWRQYPPDVLPVWVAEMDVPLAEPVARALTEAIAMGDTGYAHGPGYAQALAGFAARRWGWPLDPERTAIVPDVMLGIVEVLKLITGTGDAVVVNCPVYQPFYLFVEHMDRRVIEAPLDPEHRIDLDALDAAFVAATAGGRRAAYLLCNPHNPTGTVHTRDELSTVAELANRRGVRVVADEIHAPVVYPDATFVPYLSLPGTDDAFSLMSASKAWNLSGLKAALAIAGPEAAKDLARMPEEVSHGPSHLGVIAHSAALRDGGDWLDAVLAGLDENRRLLGDLLTEHLPAIGYRQPQGTYLAWLDCRSLGLPDDSSGNSGRVTTGPEPHARPAADPAKVFLERGRVALSSGPAFGTGGAGHARFNIATTPEVMAEAVRRMALAVS